MPTWAGIEAGGTKFVCAVGDGPSHLERTEFPTTSPKETIERAVEFFRGHAGRQGIQAAGIGSFGPVDLNRRSSTFGYITSTPKSGWQNFDFAGSIRKALDVPVGFDTDVNTAALAESRWGAGQELESLLYITVGTGIGGGAIVGGRLVHGMLHPEMGHVRVPHDWAADPYPGCCPFHGDCLEGLASGPSMEKRWGRPARELAPDHPAWALQANYLALGLVNWICTISPERIILGGGVMNCPGILASVRSKVRQLFNGYVGKPELEEAIDSYIVPPSLGPDAGVLGALALAQDADSFSR